MGIFFLLLFWDKIKVCLSEKQGNQYKFFKNIPARQSNV